ncbi:mitochondrial inner membrane protein OXA1L-like [Styela clava]
MIPRIIFSRSCASRHLLFQNRAHVASEGHYFHSPFPILYAKSNVSSNQSRNFSVSNLKNNVFNFWGETKDVNVKQEENVFIDVSNNQTVSDQTLNSSTLSSNVDDISSNQILLPDVDGVSSELSSDMLESVPDATTFADLGLGGSILPHKLLQDIFEYLNTTVGLEWIPAIAIVTLVIRTLALPCYVNMRRFSVRSNNLFPESFKLQQAMQKAAAEKNKFIMKKCHIEYQTFLQKNNINPLKPLIINIPNMIFFSSMFIGLRQMCEAHVPSLVNGGILWFQNLSISDPYMILPVLSCLSMAAIIRSGAAASELGPAGEIKGIRKILMWTPVIGLPFLIYQPSAIFIFWITSNVFSYLLVQLFSRKAVQKFFNIPTMVKHDSSVQKQLENSMNIIEKFKQLKKERQEAEQLVKKVQNYKIEMERLKEIENKRKK